MMAMTVKKLDPREAFVDRKRWSDTDAVIELALPDGARTVLTRAQARVPAWQAKRWLRIGNLKTAGGASARVLDAFMTSDGQMFYPEAACAANDPSETAIPVAPPAQPVHSP